MAIHGYRHNPFQTPTYGQQQQPQRFAPPVAPNPFQIYGSQRAVHPPGDGFTQFQGQIANKHIQPNLERPKPPEGMGTRFLGIG